MCKQFKRQTLHSLRNSCLTEGEPDEIFGEHWASNLLDRHPEISRALEDARDLPDSDGITIEDVEAIGKLLADQPNLKNFVLFDFDAGIVNYRRSTIVILPGMIQRRHFNVHLIRIPGGKWLYVEAKEMGVVYHGIK